MFDIFAHHTVTHSLILNKIYLIFISIILIFIGFKVRRSQQ